VIAMRFSNQVVLITGASSGIGAALAREFAQQGANIVLTARRVDRLEALAAEIRQMGRQVLPIACDVTRDGDMEAAVAAAVKEFKEIHIVIANAGFGVTGRMDSLKIEDYRRQFETNVFGVLRTVYASMDELKKSRGTLVLIGSVSGYIALPAGSPYSMSKFAVHALAQSLRAELAPLGVSVVLIAPGFVVSEIRQVDNRGKFHSSKESADSSMNWLKMPTEKAARQIVEATASRRAERVITLHGKLAVFLKRHFPGLISFMMKKGLRNRREAKAPNVIEG